MLEFVTLTYLTIMIVFELWLLFNFLTIVALFDFRLKLILSFGHSLASVTLFELILRKFMLSEPGLKIVTLLELMLVIVTWFELRLNLLNYWSLRQELLHCISLGYQLLYLRLGYIVTLCEFKVISQIICLFFNYRLFDSNHDYWLVY